MTDSAFIRVINENRRKLIKRKKRMLLNFNRTFIKERSALNTLKEESLGTFGGEEGEGVEGERKLSRLLHALRESELTNSRRSRVRRSFH